MRFILGVLIAAVAVFIWGFLFWAVSPYPMKILLPLPNQEPVVELLKENVPADGVYLIPGGDPAEEAVGERYRQGPIATVMYHGEGAEPMDPKVLAKGFAHNLAGAFLLAIVLATAGRETYMGRFMLTFWIGMLMAIWTEMTTVVWFYFPLRYACLQQTYHLTSMIVLGSVLAYFVRPPDDDDF